jgi:hypothetical protein
MKTIIALTTLAIGISAGSAFADDSPRAKEYANKGKPAAGMSYLGGNQGAVATGDGYTRMLAAQISRTNGRR